MHATTTHPDLRPATDEVARLVAGVRDEQLAGTTPCPDYSVAALLDHLMGLCVAFTSAARKEPMPAGDGESQQGAATADNLDPDWRERLPVRLRDLAQAWDDPAAWEGTTSAGGVDAPAPEIAVVALDELVIHGWDLARATGQSFDCDPVSTEAVLAFAEANATIEGSEQVGLFGPAVAVPDDAPDLDRALGFAGRRPDWTPDPR